MTIKCGFLLLHFGHAVRPPSTELLNEPSFRTKGVDAQVMEACWLDEAEGWFEHGV
jgi:hypothetical protein